MNKLLGTAAAAYVASGAVLAQPELLATTDAQIQLVEQITRLRAEGGPTPEGAIDPLRALALSYQESGNNALAIVALEEARHVTRVHQGLTSADEALLLRQQVRSEKALGDHQRVWDLEQDMVTIARQHLDDIRMVPIFRELAEDRSEALAQYRAGYLPPEVYFGCYYGDGGCRSGSKLAVYRRFRAVIRAYYAAAIEVVVKNGDYASQELRELEKQAIQVTTSRAPSLCRTGTLDELLALPLVGTCLEPSGRNVGGWDSLLRLIAYEIRSGAPAADRANAIAELADWHLLVTPAERRRFANGDTAVRLYERAYRELQQSGDVRASTAQIFAPEVPITLPTLEPNPFAAVATADSSRYIEVAFAVTKYGRGEQIEILATGKDATRAEERDLIRLIESTSFRPRVVDGELSASAPVQLRYYLP